MAVRAAFSQQALEQDEAGLQTAPSVDQLTRTIIAYRRWLDALGRQTAFVNGLRERTALFPQQTEEAAASAAASVRPSA